MKKILAANRGEIAIRIMRAATELGLRTATIYSDEDRLSLHRFKADEAYVIGHGKGPVAAYLDIDGIIALAKERNIDAIHPGYGFLSENRLMADACRDAGITFIGPPPELLTLLGNKVEARRLAEQAGVPVVPGLDEPVSDVDEACEAAKKIGFPIIIKAAFGGGGRGMRVVESEAEFRGKLEEARKEAQVAFGDGAVFLERYIARARHIEVQILADAHGNVLHLYERDCSVQRRHQKVVEVAPAANLPAELRAALCDAAVKLAREAGYVNAGTVEFLLDVDKNEWFFIEVNPRIQVEHTVTETVVGIDIVQAQILIAQGCRLHEPPLSLPKQQDVHVRGFALQCRITTEDPENQFAPDYGRITTYRSPAGLGIRLDGATAYAGSVINPYYDSLLVKMTAWDNTLAGACHRSDRALREFRIRGVKTNIPFLENVVNHPSFQAGEVTTNFLDQHPELFEFRKRRDRATRLLSYIAGVIVNGNATVKDKPRPAEFEEPPVVPFEHGQPPPPGTRQRLQELGPEKFAAWVREQKPLLMTDTTFRDAHQSLLATRVRTHDLLQTSDAIAHRLPNLFSLEMWGGATFDASMRFLHEDPWQRLRELRVRVPNICFQMLLRASNAVGYTSYPDNVVREFVLEAARQGIDVFRIFDSLNCIDNMQVAMDAVHETGAICEPAICYTGDILDPGRPKYSLAYYVDLAKRLEKMGAHILGIKDMAGLCKPYAAFELVQELKREIRIPIHFHTHDSSGLNAATLLKAAEAGVDIVDGAVAALSGQTSQPNLNSMVEALRNTPRDTGLDSNALNDCSRYWETVRTYYVPFDDGPAAGSASLYQHEIPGGQYTNLKQQASAMGLGHRWPEVERMYAEVNQLFGDIVKVTPSSKVVGDMALFLIVKGMTPDDVLKLRDDHDVAFPDSVADLFAGSLGTPPGGWPEKARKILLRGKKPIQGRPGEYLPPADFDAVRKTLEKTLPSPVGRDQVLSYLLYPEVFEKFSDIRRDAGDVSVLPTPIFFYGMDSGKEYTVDIEPGKTLVIRCLTIGNPHQDGTRTVFFELNGQPREVAVRDDSLQVKERTHPKAEAGEPGHIGAPTPGLITGLYVQAGGEVKRNDKLLSLEAMKMQSTIYAPADGRIAKTLVEPGDQVEAKDLLLVLEIAE
ncbi:MAG: pyruvate carboxylase [Acidobacteria bacterium]|nr:pyruvate carboxylase [Acidobacteriota bacterium]